MLEIGKQEFINELSKLSKQNKFVVERVLQSFKKYLIENDSQNEFHIEGMFKLRKSKIIPTDNLESSKINIEIEFIDKVTETFFKLLKGQEIQKLELPQDYPENEIKQLYGFVNKFIEEYSELSKFMYTMSRGELEYEPPSSQMIAVQSFKSLQASLRHLTFKTRQIAEGDFEQKVDFMGDFSKAFNKMTVQLKEAFEKIETQNEKLKVANELTEIERNKSDMLLLNILPHKVASDLKEFGKSEPQIFDNVTIFFSDIVNFTSISSKLEPTVLISELNEIFTKFDEIIEANNCERIKTIGDAYLAVCGIPEPNSSHAYNIVNSASEIIDYIKKRNSESSIKWDIRIGINSGKLVGGIVGIKKYQYDIFGDTVNTASRLEQLSEPLKINISESTFDLVKSQFSFIEREPMEVKGKGLMKMFFLDK